MADNPGNRFFRTSLWAALLIFLSLPWHPNARGPNGVVVDSVQPGSVVEKAGFRAGDLLLDWSVEFGGQKYSGTLANPFRWTSFKDSQVYIAPASIAVMREGRQISLTMPIGARGPDVRPQMPDKVWDLVAQGKVALKSKEPEIAFGLWRKAVAECEGKRLYEAAAWVELKLATAMDEMGLAKETEEACKRACTLADRSGDPIARWEARSAFSLVCRKAKNYTAAAALLEEAMAIIVGQKCGVLDEASCLNEMGYVAYGRGDTEKALQYFRQSYEIRFSEAPGTLLEARSCNNVGVVSSDRGDLAETRRFYERAIAIKEKQNPGTLDFASSLNNLGILLQVTGDLDGAEKAYSEALELKERLAPGSDDLAVSLNNLGSLRERRGDFQGAEATLKKALAIYESRDPSGASTADTILNLGLIAQKRGDLALAEALWQRSLEIYQRNNPASLDVAKALNNLALVAEDRGDLDEARRLFSKAIEIKRKAAPDSLDVATTLQSLGDLARMSGDLATARRLITETLEIRKKNAPDSPEVAASMHSLAMLRGDEGDADGEIAGYEEALAMIRRITPGSLNEGIACQSLANSLWKKGEREKAKAYCNSAIEISRRLAPGSTTMAQDCTLMGRICWEGGEHPAGISYLREAVGALEAQRAKFGGGSGAMERFSEQFSEIYKNLADMLVETGQGVEAFSVIEGYRARALIEMLAERDLDFRRDAPEELLRQKRVLDKSFDDQQEKLAGLDPEKEGEAVAYAQGRLAEIRAGQRELEEKIRARSPRLASLQYPRHLDLAGASAALPKGRLLLSYSAGTERTLLFALLDGRLETFIIPIKNDLLQAEVRAFRREVSDPSSKMSSSKRGRGLYSRLIRPASKMLRQAVGVIICADGPLHALPFAALQDDRGNFFGVTHAISRAASVTMFAEESKRPTPSGQTVPLAAFGDPVYTKTSGIAEAGKGQIAGRRDFDPLPYSRAELERLCALAGKDALCYAGAEATESRAMALGPEVRRVHFACHGLLDERFPLDSALVLSPPPPGEEGNGALQAWEIFEGMRIDADLVTLSACETALGKEMGGEGLVGLTRAFQYAGARSVVATLWRVSDEGTADFMARFYTHLLSGLTEPEALRRARSEAISAAKGSHSGHPSCWAAFELIGSR